MPALILSVPNLATKWAVHVHCHKVQNTEVIYITLNDHTSCSQALTTKAKKNEHTTLLIQSYKGSCILCKMLNQQFICCSRLQPLKTKYPSLEIRPQTSSHITQAQRQFPLRHCTTLNKILYAKRVMGKNEEKQHKAQAELLEQVCITSVFKVISVLIVLPFVFLHLMLPM